MADPLAQLAPPIGPQPPLASTALAASPVGPAWLVIALLLLAACVFAIFWWRARWQRGLRRVGRVPRPSQAADLLATLARRHQVQAPATWWQALDRARFGPEGSATAEVIEPLLPQARGFVPRDRLLPSLRRAWSR